MYAMDVNKKIHVEKSNITTIQNSKMMNIKKSSKTLGLELIYQKKKHMT